MTTAGRVAASKALESVRLGMESPRETLLRLLLIRGGLPEPDAGVEIVDGHGKFLARVDLCYREWRVVVEYDGDQHRTDPRQYSRDIARIEALQRAGWTVVRVLNVGLFRGADETIARVTYALRTRGWRG